MTGIFPSKIGAQFIKTILLLDISQNSGLAILNPDGLESCLPFQ